MTGEEAGHDLVAVEGPQQRLGPLDQRDELAIGQLGQRRHLEQAGVGVGHGVGDETFEGGPQTADPPRRPQPPRRRHRVELGDPPPAHR